MGAGAVTHEKGHDERGAPPNPVDDDSPETVVAGRVGLVGLLVLAAALAGHPSTSTEQYADPAAFLEHVNGFWVGLHLVAASALVTVPLVIDAWQERLATPAARMLGRWAFSIAIIGTAAGVVHLVATDTMTFYAFTPTYEASGGSEAALTGADVLLRLHASTLTAWTLSQLLVLPTVMALTMVADRRHPAWLVTGTFLAAALQVPALAITLVERQWTSLSDGLFLRLGATTLLLVLLVISNRSRRGLPRGTAHDRPA